MIRSRSLSRSSRISRCSPGRAGPVRVVMSWSSRSWSRYPDTTGTMQASHSSPGAASGQPGTGSGTGTPPAAHREHTPGTTSLKNTALSPAANDRERTLRKMEGHSTGRLSHQTDDLETSILITSRRCQLSNISPQPTGTHRQPTATRTPATRPGRNAGPRVPLSRSQVAALGLFVESSGWTGRLDKRRL
jgi:hypothetical protein